MVERVILISGSPEWREAMAIALEDLEEDNIVREVADGSVMQHAHAFQPTAAILHVDWPSDHTATAGRMEVVQTALDELRSAFFDLPIVLVASVLSEQLSALTERYKATHLELDYDAEGLATEALAAIRRLRAADELAARPVVATSGGLETKTPLAGEAKPSSAAIDIAINQTTLIFTAYVGNRKESFKSVSWSRRDVDRLNRDFDYWESNEARFKAVVNVRYLTEVSKTLLHSLSEPTLDKAQRFCRLHMEKHDGTISYRFIIADGNWEYVPFELVASGNPGEYLRSMYPMARKLTVEKPRHLPDRELRKHATDVLLINANLKGEGSFVVPGHTFKEQVVASFGHLERLDEELAAVEALYRASRVDKLHLSQGEDSIDALDKKFSEGVAVVHFAGHSVRSDSGEVFLALPGMDEGEVIPYSAENFAGLAAKADVRLVILSSCEAASCRALSRLASFGVPAVAGFRWPVSDSDAKTFTSALHDAFCNTAEPIPIARAFHKALLGLKSRTAGQIGWLSPVLMIQRTAWHDFGLEG